MKYIIKYSIIFLLICLTLSLADCKKNNFLNVNTNPNYPANVTVNYVLPTCEANMGYMVCNTLAIYGGIWSQYWTQDPTYGSAYGTFEEYLNIPSDNDNVWPALYAVGTNLNIVINNADTSQKNYAAIAYILKAYDFQLITDGWDKVPLTAALKGTANLDPQYDPGQQVYDSIASWIYTGIKIMDLTKTSPPEDLIYPNQPMAQWQKFANTLLMKVYLRQCRQSPSRATAGFQALAAEMSATGSGFLSTPSTPGLSSTGDDAILQYVNSVNRQFPLYATQSYLQVQNLTASATAINYMLSVNDPRIADFYQLDYYGAYGGEAQGDWRNLNGQPDYNFSPIGTEVLSPTAGTRLMTASESQFLQAEAVVRGLLPGGNAAALYAAGVTKSFACWTNSSTANVSAYLSQSAVNYANATTTQAQLNLILTQKWASMCGNQTYEAWTEWRRTRIPTFFTVSLCSVLPPLQFPRRLVYPSVELNENTSFPGEQAINTAVWWDVN